MKKLNFWIICGALTALGSWQLSSIAQQPSREHRGKELINEEEFDFNVEEQIEILNDQARALSEEAENLSRNGDDSEDSRRERKKLNSSLQELRAKTEALTQQVKHMHEAKAQSDKARGAAEEARHRAEEFKAKFKEEAKSKGRRDPKVDRRAPIRTEVIAGEVADKMMLRPGAKIARNMMIFDHNGKKVILRNQVDVSPEEVKRLEEFKQLVNDYRSEENEERKEELKNNIREQLESQLDRDIESRKTQLSQMEERVERLRNQLESSENTKSTTVDSLLQMLDGDSDNPYNISPAWVDALSAAGPYRHTIEETDQVIANVPVAVDLSVMPVPAMPQIAIGIPPQDVHIVHAGAAIAPPAVPSAAPIPIAPPQPEVAEIPEPPEPAEQPEQSEQPEAPELPEPKADY